MKEINYLRLSLGEIVTNDFRTAEVFKEAGLDFCCGGKKTLEFACNEKSIAKDVMLSKLKDLEFKSAMPGQNFNDWPLNFLCDYIVNTHHIYVQKTLSDLVFYTQKIANVHGIHHPELNEVADLFAEISKELVQHLKNEEEILFPAIKEILINNNNNAAGKIRSEISRMSGEHEFAGGAMDRINQITGQYMVPADGCNTYHVTFKLLQEFEDDLHIHVHLENNILFPKALDLTNSISISN